MTQRHDILFTVHCTYSTINFGFSVAGKFLAFKKNLGGFANIFKQLEDTDVLAFMLFSILHFL